MLSDVGRDCRYAFRGLLRARAFAVTVVLTLALGIGANAIIFSAVDAVLLRDAPVADPDRLVDVYTSSGANPYGSSSYPDYFDLRDSGTFEGLAAYRPISVALDANGRSEVLAGELVSGNYFDVLGVRIPLGRAFAPHEDQIGTPIRVVVLSHALWHRVFNANPSTIGQTVRLNGNSYTVIGVTPPGFVGPLVGRATDAWVPTPLQPEVDPASAALRRSRGHARKFDVRSSRGLNIVARLPRGQSIAQAVSHAAVISSRLERAHAETNRNRRFTITPLGEGRGLRVETRPILRQLMGAVAIVLLIACVNVASLLLVRAASRRKEVAVRVAIGASPGRLVRQCLAESVLLALLGSVGASLVAWLGAPLLHVFVIPEAVDLSVNSRVLGVTFGMAVGSGLLFGLAPVVQTLGRDTIGSLRDEGGAVATGTRAARLRGAFVILQVALSLMLLVGAGLFLRTLGNAYSVDLPYQTDRTLVAALNLDVRGYSQEPEKGLGVYEQILSRVAALPGVVAAGAARMTVLSGGARSTAVSSDGRPIERDNSNALGVRANIVSHRYLETMNIPIIRGRSFGSDDGPGRPRVSIVSQSLVETLWPNDDPIGKALWDEGNHRQTVVGVVPDAIYASTVERDEPPTVYLPLAQNYESAVTLHVRAAGDPRSLVPAIRDAVREVDNQLVVERPELLRHVLDRTLSKERMMAALIGAFAGIALLLTIVGLYGVMAHAAGQRTAEIGIRVAMGAQPASIVALIIAHGLRLLAIGSALGFVGALVSTRLIATQLFGVTPHDPLTFAAVGAVLATTGLIACAIPALRATRVDPITALRRL